MAIFCALCAQPRINLPEDWRQYENRCVLFHVGSRRAVLTYCFSKNLFMRGFMMDGNFKAEHMKMRNPDNDVSLSDGTGFMVSRLPYEAHLKSAVERRQVSIFSLKLHWLDAQFPRLKQKLTCHDHRAVNNVNKHSGHLESTGIDATACIHGAFVPDSVVDFQKGEA